jgi:hypothetical protein
MSRSIVLTLCVLGCSSSQSVEVLTSFDAAQGQLPEGLALRDGTAYVGFATDVWVTHTDRGGLIRIPILANGAAGTATAVVQDCAFAGLDGLVRARDGSFVAAINGQNKVVRLDERGAVSTILAGTPLDFPASVAEGDHGELVVTAAAFVTAMSGMNPAPALITIDR